MIPFRYESSKILQTIAAPDGTLYSPTMIFCVNCGAIEAHISFSLHVSCSIMGIIHGVGFFPVVTKVQHLEGVASKHVSLGFSSGVNLYYVRIKQNCLSIGSLRAEVKITIINLQKIIIAN